MSVKPSRTEHESSSYNLSQADDESTESLGYLAIQFVMGLAGLVGLWGLLCLVSGLSSSEGFYRLCANWISAVSGM